MLQKIDDTASGERVRSFIDLGDFADAQISGSGPRSEEGVSFLESRVLLPLAKGAVTAGVILLEPGEGHVANMPADEFIIVHKGSIELRSDGKDSSLLAGNSAALARSLEFSWCVREPTAILFLRHDGGLAGPVALTLIDENAALEPSNPPALELLASPTPSCRNHTDYRSEDGEFVCGTWDSTPYHRLSMPYRHYELMYLLEGRVSFEDQTGRRATFAQGDIFLIELGAQCSWESEVDVKKVYAIHRPA